MKNFKKKYNNSYVYLISMMTLFFVFMGMSLILIIFSMNSYKRIRNNVEYTFNSTVLINYVSNKIKSFDSLDSEIILIKQDNNSNILALKDKKTKLITYIYEKNDKIYENVQSSDIKLNKDNGQVLFEAKNVSFEVINDRLLLVKIKTVESDLVEKFINLNAVRLDGK